MKSLKLKNTILRLNSFRKERGLFYIFLKYSFLLLFVLYLFGISPITYISATIKNITTDYDTISFYPSGYEINQDNNNYLLGWWNSENALGEPTLQKKDSLIYFSDTNSAFYSGGKYEMILSSFSLPEEYSSDSQNEENQGEVEILDTPDNTSSEIIEDRNIVEDLDNDALVGSAQVDVDDNIIATPTPEMMNTFDDSVQDTSVESVQADGDEDDVEKNTSEETSFVEEDDDNPEENTEEISEPEDNDKVDENNTDNAQVLGVFEEEENISPDSVEIIKDSVPGEDADVEVIDTQGDEASEDNLSFYNFYKIAQAQSEEESSLNKFGEFKSAKINFSIAYTSMDAFYDNNDNEQDTSAGSAQEDIDNDNIATPTPETIDISDDSGQDVSVDSPPDDLEDSNNADINTDSSEEDDTSTGSAQDTSTGSAQVDNNEESVEEDSNEEAPVVEEGDNSEEIIEEISEPETSDEVEENNSEDVSLFNFKKIARAESSLDEKIIIWYSVDTKEASGTVENIKWHKLKTIYAENFSNALNEGFLSIEAPEIKSWSDLDKLAIKLEGVSDDDNTFVFYLDAAWVDIDYKKAEDAPEPEEEKLKRWQDSLEMISGEEFFDINDEGEFRFKYTKNSQKILESLGEFFGFVNYWDDVDLEVSLISPRGEKIKAPISIIFEDNGEFSFKLPEIEADIEPGKYSIDFTIIDSSGETEETINLSHEFVWGVLAFNTDKAIYYPNEEANLQMAVLDDYGHTICDADLSLEISNPSGDIVELSTEKGDIFVSEECGPRTVTNKPDYFTNYLLGEKGNYKIRLIAKTKNGIREVEHFIKVRDKQNLDVSRKSATRIFPKSNYIMEINIIAKEDYLGAIREQVPAGFKILSQDISLLNNQERDPFSKDYKFEIKKYSEVNILSWEGVELHKGDELLIKYLYDAPDVSPEFYLVGPLETDNFSEDRKWQIASDALNKRARTVMIMAGIYNGDGTTGQNSDTNQTFSTFNFRLAESGVEIKNAYIMFESLYEAYSNSNVYTGYNLAFDSCVESCTADAFSGTNRILQDDNTTLSYSETESNEIRLLADVSSESELSSYTGEGKEMEAQVGYRLERGAVANSISNAKAVLYITYLYDADSENITNTISYPLDSTDGTDSGTRQSSIGACTRNSNCPIFDYKMDIPEWSGLATSTDRVSQWFRVYGANDGNNATDMTPDVNIQNYDVNSETFHHESQNSGTQGNLGAMYFPDWASSGYAEGQSQQLEVYFNSGTNYDVGGEVFETYIASSSATTKTRTVTFPFGVINNGNTTALTNSSVDVYFPENGNSTGIVDIKSAYFRIITHNQNSATLSTTISSKVGSNATSSDYIYNYNGGGSVIKPSHNIIHIIPSTDYTELESANANTAKEVIINATQNATTYGGISAELVITYTYTDESTGYLTNINLYGGQSNTNPETSASLSTANSVMPEASGKTVLSAGLLSSYLNSDSGGTVGAGTIFLLDANLSTSTPSCTPAYRAEPDDMNSFSEFYKNVTSAMNTTNNQSYTACYADDESLTDTDGAKMEGQFIYTYQWDNSPPTGSFNSVVHKLDGSGVADISIEINDSDEQEIKAKLEYEATSTCSFTSPLDPDLDETDENITADFGDPAIENDNIYQIGTDAAPIITASGTNSVLFDWDLPQGVEATYCLRLTANDGMTDQNTAATSTFYIDTIKPTVPGVLSLNSRTGTSINLNLGTSSIETNFKEYKIFYKEYDGSDPNENDSVFASSTDTNLGDINFNGATTTTISSLIQKTTYSFAIWAYDDYGNRASSSRVDIYTNDAPISSFNSASQRTDGSGMVDISIEVDDNNNDDTNILKVRYVLGSACDFTSPSDPTLDEASENISADFGAPSLENDWDYQIGTSGAYILTSPGSNTLDFDWLSATDEPSADATYCLQTIANDSYDDQIIISTTTLTIDNVNPTASGDLSIDSIGLESITISFDTGNPATDTNEPSTNAYKIFYKEGVSGVSESDMEYDLSALNSYDYSGATSTTITGLTSDTSYVINIWAYDSFGNKTASTEIVAKTNSTLVNESLILTNATSTNVLLLDGSTEWNFKANVSETNGWYALDEVELGLADLGDNSSTFDDLRFKWSQSLQSFSEVGSDLNNAVVLSPNSTSTCAVNNCEINFKLIFNKDFASSSVEYDAELFSTNDSAKEVSDTYADLYQARYIELEQIHYRWRNDDGGE